MLIYRKVPPKDLKTKLKIFQDQVIAGQRMANAIEREYGWPLTKIYPADPGTDNVASNNKFYYIAASKRWIKSPVMLSLFTLLFRMSTNNQRFQFKNRITSMKSLFKVLDEIAPKISYGEMSFYRTHGKRWKLVLNNYQKLFGSRSMVSLYYPSAGGSYFFSEGINQICDENSKDKELNSAFCDIVKKHNEKTKGEML
jgi:hypothetical protein